MDMSDLTYAVEPSDFDDWAGLHELLHTSYAYMSGRIDPPSSFTAMSADDLKAKAQEDMLLVVHDLDLLVACAFVKVIDDAIHIEKIAVREDHRRNGITREMMVMAEQMALIHDKPALQIQTRIELNEIHQTFAQLGFEKAGETAHAGFDRPTSITMRRLI